MNLFMHLKPDHQYFFKASVQYGTVVWSGNIDHCARDALGEIGAGLKTKKCGAGKTRGLSHEQVGITRVPLTRKKRREKSFFISSHYYNIIIYNKLSNFEALGATSVFDKSPHFNSFSSTLSISTCQLL